MTEPVTPPTLDIPLEDAIQEMTGFELRAIQRRLNMKMEELGRVDLTIGAIFTYENRNGNKRSWASVENMTLKDMSGYFAPSPQDADPDDPDSELGKGDSSAT